MLIKQPHSEHHASPKQNGFEHIPTSQNPYNMLACFYANAMTQNLSAISLAVDGLQNRLMHRWRGGTGYTRGHLLYRSRADMYGNG